MTGNTTQQKLDAILEKLSKIETAIAVKEEQYLTLRQDVNEHSEVLDGNGKPGLKSMVAVMSDQISKVIMIQWGLGTLAVSQTLAIVGGLLTHSIHLP